MACRWCWRLIPLVLHAFPSHTNTHTLHLTTYHSTAPTSGATIYYTLDGSTPSTSSTVYTGSPVWVGGAPAVVTAKFFATRSGWADSDMDSATWQLHKPVAMPTLNPSSDGTYSGSVTVSMASATSGASIWYTTDG